MLAASSLPCSNCQCPFLMSNLSTKFRSLHLLFQSRRFVPEKQKSLGPASYNPHPVENRIDFNKVNASSNFKLPIAVKPDSVDGSSPKINKTPAPNTYNLSGVHTGKNSTISAEAAFKSK